MHPHAPWAAHDPNDGVGRHLKSLRQREIPMQDIIDRYEEAFKRTKDPAAAAVLVVAERVAALEHHLEAFVRQLGTSASGTASGLAGQSWPRPPRTLT